MLLRLTTANSNLSIHLSRIYWDIRISRFVRWFRLVRRNR